MSSPFAIQTSYQYRLQSLGDLDAIQKLMTRAYAPPHGPEAVWRQRSLLLHQTYFPDGQFVVEDEHGQVIATATSMRVDFRKALAPHTWSGITGGGTLATHDPCGNTLYGVNITVDPAHQGRGLARMLYEARIDLARRLGCIAFAAGARIPGYGSMAGNMTAEQYVREVVAKRRFDPTLSKQLHIGFRVAGLLPDYAVDPETLGYAALILLWI